MKDLNWKNPAAEHRPAPFFILNEDLETPFARDRIRAMLEQMRDLGYGGAYLHPRVGLITEYKSEAWFETVGFCLQEGKRLGLQIFLYDENSYPSGFAGGHVPALHPETRARYLGCEILRTLPNALNHFTTTVDASDLFLAAYRLESENPLRISGRLSQEELAEWTQDQHCSFDLDVSPRVPVLAFYLREMKGSPWHGEFPYVSLADPAVAPAFLRETHDEYARRFGGDFGGSIPAIFTDEPNLHTLNGGPAGATLHLSPYILGEFVRRRGYDLRDHLAELFFDYGDFAAVRFDYYETLHALWFENWALPLEEWCRRHGIALTGHYLEHDWPAPYSTPGHVHLLAHMDWPGIDLLLANALLGEPAPWFSLQNRAEPGREPHLALLIHQCASVARQFGKKKVLCEAWGAGGHASTPADYKRLGDWLIVHGVNHLVPHHSFMTIRGSRKTDHPQFFSDQSSWYLHLRPLNDHFARLCQAMSQGVDTRPILVLDPLTSAYLMAARSKPSHETLGTICNGFSHFVQNLADRFLPFDIGDEYVLEESAEAGAAGLLVGRQHYQAIVLPAEMANMRLATLRLLEAHLEKGGRIWTLMPEAPRIDGRCSPAWERLAARFAPQIHHEPRIPQFLDLLENQFPPALRLENPEALRGFAHARRQCGEQEIHLLVYSGNERGTVSLSLPHQNALIVDTLTGEKTTPLAKADGGEGLHFDWTVDGPQSLLIQTSAKPSPAPPCLRIPPPAEPSFPLRLKSIAPRSANRLVLDFCNVRLPGRPEIKGIRALMAQKEIFLHHGFLRNPWHRAIQYRRQIVDRNHFGADSGFEAVYAFEILPGAELTLVRAAIESPDLYQITINGHDLDPRDAQESEIDPWIREFPVEPWLREGENLLTVTAAPFDVRAELDNVYLLGDFSLRSTSRGFAMGSPVGQLHYGSWKTQGYPFYDRSMLYRFEIPAVPEDCTGFVLEMDAACSLANIFIGGHPMAQWGLTREPVVLPASAVEPGAELIIEVIGSPHNLFGEFHDPNAQPGIAGNAFAGVKRGPVSGDRYALKDYGLTASPALRPISRTGTTVIPQFQQEGLFVPEPITQ